MRTEDAATGVELLIGSVWQWYGTGESSWRRKGSLSVWSGDPDSGSGRSLRDAMCVPVADGHAKRVEKGMFVCGVWGVGGWVLLCGLWVL